MSKIKVNRYKPYDKEMVPGVYSDPNIRHRRFISRIVWKGSAMEKILNYKLKGK